MAKKKAKKKAAPAKEAPVVEEAPAPKEKKGEKVESEAAHVPEQVVIRRGTAVGGTRALTRSEYDKEIAKERGESK